MLITLSIISLLLGIVIGWKIGVLYIKKENALLYKQLTLMEKYSYQWSATAINNNQLYQSIAEQNSSNLSTTLNSVIHILHNLQTQQQTQTLSQKKKKKKKKKK